MDSSISDSSSNVDTLGIISAAAFAIAIIANNHKTANKYRGGPQIGRSANYNFDVSSKCHRLDRDFFVDPKTVPFAFTKRKFDRTFRIHREVYIKIRNDLASFSELYRQYPDAVNKLGTCTDFKLFTAIQTIGDNRTAFSLVNEVRQSESPGVKCMKQFCSDICSLYELEWLHRPNDTEHQQIEPECKTPRFLKCGGAIDSAGRG